jgi:hypothetical protein
MAFRRGGDEHPRCCTREADRLATSDCRRRAAAGARCRRLAGTNRSNFRYSTVPPMSAVLFDGPRRATFLFRGVRRAYTGGGGRVHARLPTDSNSEAARYSQTAPPPHTEVTLTVFHSTRTSCTLGRCQVISHVRSSRGGARSPSTKSRSSSPVNRRRPSSECRTGRSMTSMFAVSCLASDSRAAVDCGFDAATSKS